LESAAVVFAMSVVALAAISVAASANRTATVRDELYASLPNPPRESSALAMRAELLLDRKVASASRLEYWE
jgi:hypothetical protein